MPHFMDGDPEAKNHAQGHMTNLWQSLGPESRALASSPGSDTSCCSGIMSVSFLFSGHPSSLLHLDRLEP